MTLWILVGIVVAIIVLATLLARDRARSAGAEDSRRALSPLGGAGGPQVRYNPGRP